MITEVSVRRPTELKVAGFVVGVRRQLDDHLGPTAT